MFLILVAIDRAGLRHRVGLISGTFLAGYAVFRAIVELVREPDEQIGILFGWITMGQLLSLPVFAFGIYLVVRSKSWVVPAK